MLLCPFLYPLTTFPMKHQTNVQVLTYCGDNPDVHDFTVVLLCQANLNRWSFYLTKIEGELSPTMQVYVCKGKPYTTDEFWHAIESGAISSLAHAYYGVTLAWLSDIPGMVGDGRVLHSQPIISASELAFVNNELTGSRSYLFDMLCEGEIFTLEDFFRLMNNHIERREYASDEI